MSPPGAPPEESHTAGDFTPPTAPVPRLFATDDLLAGRFRIIRFLAAGGMGEVYEADDLELQERVALKTVLQRVADDERAMERFRREIQLARRVTHPCVCRTYDVFRHRLPPTPTGEEREITFLSMEFLRGETLSDRIRRAGPLTTTEALPIAAQIASALAAAHEAGVVHRDFKSANIVLVPGPRATRAVVTDFGLARDSSIDTRAEGVMGTPAYMAPEQVEGRGTSPATDIYALGIVLYEAVTGRRPFETRRFGAAPSAITTDSPAATARRRISQPPQPPRDHVPDLDPRWEAAILRCLEREPAARFASPLDVARALDGPQRPRRWWRRLAAALVIALGFGALAARHLMRGPAALVRRSVAVMGFRNLSGRSDAAWLSTALAEMLRVELAAGSRLRTVPGETVARTRVELALADADSYAGDTLARLRANLGTDMVVVGSYLTDAGGRLRINLIVQETAAGETIATVTSTGSEANVVELLGGVGSELRQKLAIGDVPAGEAGPVRASQPATPAAARAYAEGLERLRLFDALAAREHLAQSIAAEPGFPLSHAAIAGAWAALGHPSEASAEAQRAFELSAGLPREERLVVEGRAHEAAREWPAAIQTYQTLTRSFPDDLEHGLRLAAAQTAGARGRDALATIQALRRLPAPGSDDPRIDLAEAQAAHAVSDDKRSREAAASAAAKGLAVGARLLVAHARFQEAWSLRILGERQAAAEACSVAQGIFAALGDRDGLARAGNLAATISLSEGDLAAARTSAEQALAIAREIGNSGVAAGALGHIATVLRRQGELGAARLRIEEALAIQRELGDRLEEAIALNNLAGVLDQQGDLAGARATYERALFTRREIGDRRGEAYDLCGLGRVHLQLGDPLQAQPLVEQSLRLRREIGQRGGIADSLHALGDIALARGDFAGARGHYDEALQLRIDTAAGQVAETRGALALLALETGDFGQAVLLAGRAAGDLERAQRADDAAAVRAIQARALLEQGHVAEAVETLAPGRARALSSQRLALRIGVAIVAARLEAAAGHPDAARRSLAEAVAEATRRGHRSLALEARMALAGILPTPAARQTDLAAVDLDASRAGLLLLAQRARPRP